jgi:predicted outer membrane protein
MSTSITSRISVVSAAACAVVMAIASADPLPPDSTYRPLPTLPLDVVRKNDEAARQFSIGGQAEVDLGKLGESKATEASTREFSLRMVDDHGAAHQPIVVDHLPQAKRALAEVTDAGSR